MNPNDTMRLSYNRMRRAIGWLGIALPIVVWIGAKLLGCPVAQPSISHYFYTVMGSVFVGTLAAVGLFLINYKGQTVSLNNKRLHEGWLTNVAGFCAFGIALFPTNRDGVRAPETAACCVNDYPYPDYTGSLHYIFAALFFAAIVVLCWRYFTLTDGYVTHSKRRRNRLYRTCGGIMTAACLVILLFHFGPDALSQAWPNHTFWMEGTALWAFGVAWLVKGKQLLDDTAQEKADKAIAEATEHDVGTVRFEPERAAQWTGA